jgi:hypothetical protein
MAMVFGKQGEYGKALEWCQRALNGQEKVLGLNHPDTLATVNYMATLSECQLQSKQAHSGLEKIHA